MRLSSWLVASLHLIEIPVGTAVRAENLCRQAIFMNHASCAVTPPYPEMVQVCDAVGQRAEGAACFRVRCGRWVS